VLLSLQKHNHSSEHWLIINGNPIIILNNRKFTLKAFNHIFVPKKTIHRILNKGQKNVRVIEAQIGGYLKESDIIRYNDFYGRA
jgi:mannose-1-phosphate guanylyltransferase/mannose-6-phosphate isomerase